MSLLNMTGITKIYPGTIALNKVNFHLDEGEIVSLLGENGAGKTTLMKILYGMTKADEGQIEFRGEVVSFHSPLDAIEKQICMVHQHFMLVPAFSVIDNIIVGSEPGKGLFIDRKEAEERIKVLIDQFNFNIDPTALVDTLSVGEQQRVEILKALYRNANVLILDEPTAVLTPQEVDDLFVILNRLRSEGKSIIIITHKLKETMAIADRIVILRDGNLIADDINPKDVNTEILSNLMVGRNVDLLQRHPSKHIGKVCFSVENLTVIDNGHTKVDNISFSIHEGEILGVAGIEGNGQTQLIEAITGLRKPDSMRCTIDGKEISGACDTFIKNHVGHIPEDRLALGLVKDMSIKENMILGYHKDAKFCSHGLMKEKSINNYAEQMKTDYLVKAPSIEAAISSLSGGNQQKVIIARVFSENPKVIIAAHPTRGIDIGAIEYIHSKLQELRESGVAILLISADLDEVRTLSDRLIVMYEGKIVAEGNPESLSETEIGLMMTGAGKKQKEDGDNE